MSDRLDPCRRQPVDFIRAEHQETVEAMRRAEISIQCRRDYIWWNYHPEPGEMSKAGRLRDIDNVLRRLTAVLCSYYDYPDDYLDILGTGKELPIQGHYYNGFWGNGYDKCPENCKDK